MGGGKPSMPSPGKDEKKKDQNDRRRSLLSARGQMDNILTSPVGIVSPAPVATKSLTGA